MTLWWSLSMLLRSSMVADTGNVSKNAEKPSLTRMALLNEFGRLLIVVCDHRDLYEHLSHALAPGGPIRIVLDAPDGGPRIGRQHVEGMLQSHGLSLIGE